MLSYTLAVNESARYKKFATDVRDTIAKEPFNYVMKATESVSLCLHIILSYHSNLIMIVNHTAEIQLPCSPPPSPIPPLHSMLPLPLPTAGRLYHFCSLLPSAQVSVFAQNLYDAVYMYAYGLQDMLNENPAADKRDGAGKDYPIY